MNICERRQMPRTSRINVKRGKFKEIYLYISLDISHRVISNTEFTEQKYLQTNTDSTYSTNQKCKANYIIFLKTGKKKANGKQENLRSLKYLSTNFDLVLKSHIKCIKDFEFNYTYIYIAGDRTSSTTFIIQTYNLLMFYTERL